MKCLVLTGISRRILENLMRRVMKTVELRSAHNIATALKAEVGDCIFLTSARIFDIDRGTPGLIAEVQSKEVSTHSLIFASESLIQEDEMTVIRLRLNIRGAGRVIKVYNTGIIDSTEAEVLEVSYFDAR